MAIPAHRLSLPTVGLVVAATLSGLVVAAPPAAADTCLPPPLQTVCVPTLPGGGGTSTSTVSPTSVANTATAAAVTVTDSLAPLYQNSGGVAVALVGPGSATTDNIAGTSVAISGNTITAAFDLVDTNGFPADPGAYNLVITPADLGGVLPTGVGPESIPMTVTAKPPAPAVTLTVAPGSSAAASITSTGDPFAKGDTVSTSNSGITFNQPKVTPTAITGTVTVASSVAPGTYQLLVTDTSGQKGSASITVAVTPTLTLSPSARHVVAGASVTFSGVLASSAGGGLSGKQVAVYAKPDGGSAAFAGRATTGSSGNYNLVLRPLINAHYIAYFAGDAGDAKAFSNSVPHVTVAPKVTAKPAHKKVARHKAIVVKGKVTPAERGATATLDYVKAGKRHRVASAVIQGSGHFRLATHRPAHRGHYRFVVLVPARTLNTAGTSNVFAVRRK